MPANAISENLVDRLVASVNQIGSARTSPGLYRVLLRLLSRGEPITIAELAAAAGRVTDDVQRIVADWPDTEYDQQGRIVGWGLTLRPTSHGFNVDGKQLYTWCALDTLFFPAVIGRPPVSNRPAQAWASLYVLPSIRPPALPPSTRPLPSFRLLRRNE